MAFRRATFPTNILFACMILLGAGIIALVKIPKEVAWQHRMNPDAAIDLSPVRSEPILPIPARPEVNRALLTLGRDLFFDPRLSVDGTLSCASCHSIENGGDDGLRFSIGVDGQVGTRNAPTVLNASLNFRQFWDGHARDLKSQVSGPLFSSVEMGWASWEALITHLRTNSDLQKEFKAVFKDGLTAENLVAALTAFEEWLLTPNAPFDQWLKGDDTALSPDALAGYARFKELGCIACHQGRNVGGSMFQRIGHAVASPFEGDADHLGRFEQTRKEYDRHRFKVPSLRNATRTAPYLHDGSLETLPEAIRFMAEYQLDVEISDEDVRLIEAFIASLDGDLPPVSSL